MNNDRISVAILDNDPWSLQAIARWIDCSSTQYRILWQTTSSAKAIHHCLYMDNIPNTLILDMSLSDASGVSVCAQIRKHNSSIGIIGITAYDPNIYEKQLAQAGAQALIAKEKFIEEYPKILPVVARGHSADPNIFMTPQAAYTTLTQASHAPSIQQLSSRELQILQLYCQDYSTSEIADKLEITPNTVFTYLHRASVKLGSQGKLETIRLCKQYNLI